MKVHIAESDAHLRHVSGVLLQLRPAFDIERLVAQIKEQMRQGYRVAYVEDASEVLCVAGFVVGTKLAWGKHVYVDDLVTAEHRAHRFYLREGFNIGSHHFSITDLAADAVKTRR